MRVSPRLAPSNEADVPKARIGAAVLAYTFNEMQPASFAGTGHPDATAAPLGRCKNWRQKFARPRRGRGRLGGQK